MNEQKLKSLKELLALTRGQLIGKYGMAIIACLTVSMTELFILMLASSNPTTSAFSYLVKIAIVIVVDLLMGILIYGQHYFFLKLVRGDEKLTPNYIFYGLKNNMDKAILVEGIFTLVSMITLIPIVMINLDIIVIPADSYYKVSAIIELADIIIRLIAKLYFGLVFYILCDHPEYSVKEIVYESMRLMNGKKIRLLLVYLSLIPLLILGFLACFIGILWIIAYEQTLLANFYLDAIGEEPVMQNSQPNSDSI